jgi:hypothetical protein
MSSGSARRRRSSRSRINPSWNSASQLSRTRDSRAHLGTRGPAASTSFRRCCPPGSSSRDSCPRTL